MKYLVELKFTNPAHEHVSLRRRVESVTRLVEARNEGEAVLRASNQQRSLGFMIREAKVVKEKSHDKGADETIVSKGKEVMKKAEGKDEKDEEKDEEIEEAKGTASYPLLKPGQKLKPMKLKMGEGFDPEPSDIAAHLVKKHGKGKVTKDHVNAYERDRDSNKAIDKEEVMKHVQKMSEEVEQLSERSYLQYSGVIHSNVGNAKHGEEKDEGHHYTLTVPSHRDVGDHLSGKRAYSRVARENPHLEPHHVKAILQSTGNDKEDVEVEHGGKTYKHRLYNNQDPDYIGEEVELDEAQKKLKPSYWKAEWRLGTQSEVDKNNKKIFDKLAKTDPVKAAAFHDNLMRMKKKDVKEEVEQVDEVKAVKAYDKEGKLVGRYRSMDHAKQMKPGHTYKVEEGVELDEANMRFDYEAAARPKSSDVKNFLNRDKNARAAAASKKYIRRMTKLGGLGPNQTKKDTEAHMKAHFEEVVTETSKEGKDVMRGMRASLKSMDLRHGVDSDKRDSGYKMSPAVRAAQAKSDALSKPEKKHQAGTLGAHKARKAAEKMVDAAKKKVNKINMQPSMEAGKQNA